MRLESNTERAYDKLAKTVILHFAGINRIDSILKSVWWEVLLSIFRQTMPFEHTNISIIHLQKKAHTYLILKHHI